MWSQQIASPFLIGEQSLQADQASITNERNQKTVKSKEKENISKEIEMEE